MIDSLYFDHHTATRPFPEVVEKYHRLSKEYWASSSSPHFLGQQQSYLMQKSYALLSHLLGASPQDQGFFSSGGEEAIVDVFFHVYKEKARKEGKTLFLIPETEEKKILAAARQLESLGCTYKLLPVNHKGQVTPQILEEAITPRTALVSLSWAHGLTGVLHPVADLVEVCQKKGVLIHLDGSYVLGKNYFKFQDLGVDFFTLEGSLIGAPKHTGFTLVKQGLYFSSLMDGKSDVSTSALAAFAQAVEMLEEKLDFFCMEGARLRDLFEQEIEKRCEGAKVLFKQADRLPNASVMAFPPLHFESFLFLLNSQGVYANGGGGKFPFLFDVLKSCQSEKGSLYHSLSFVFSHDVEESDIERAVTLIGKSFDQLKQCAGALSHDESFE